MSRFARGRIGALRAKPRYPARVLNYLAVKLAYRLGWIRTPFLPAALDVEPNNTCNFRCPHCQVPYWSKPAAFLDEERFARILRQAPQSRQDQAPGHGRAAPQQAPRRYAEARRGARRVDELLLERERAHRRDRGRARRPERHRDHLQPRRRVEGDVRKNPRRGEVRKGDREHRRASSRREARNAIPSYPAGRSRRGRISASSRASSVSRRRSGSIVSRSRRSSAIGARRT